jgi:hypothetical protein
MIWLIFGAYLVITCIGYALSFTMRKSGFRLGIRILTGALTIPILLIVVVAGLLWWAQPPSLSALQSKFASRHSDLETILRMSNEDANFTRIAPDFLDRDADGQFAAGRFRAGDPKAGLPESRWKAYRNIYAKNGIQLGIQRDNAGDAFIMVNSFGLLNDGHTSGYLYCASTPVPISDAARFQPCVLHQEKGRHNFDPNTPQNDNYFQAEGYLFQKLDEHWFAYDEGPS